MAILDSGARRQFYTPDGREAGVRDIAEGKGRCDLLPLIEVSNICQMYRICIHHRIHSLSNVDWLSRPKPCGKS